ncbi:lamin-B1-like [Dendronephthya gigantea]|uniref:lamin-B1-like n=1 Tax=Dendronephthya gigantea TaxID=151771 RepID=UPI0010695100|nr:lamin-B1-like [Dendronephthya gigantea]
MATATLPNNNTPGNKKSKNASFTSPTKISRMQERDELGHLNNRLSVYIERVKNLEAENASLSAEIETTKVRTENEVNNMKNMFENELNDARKMLDETSMEKARIQLESGRNASIVAEYKVKYDDTSKKLNTCEENLQITESKLSQNEKILEKTIRDKRRMEGDIDVLEKENFALKEAVETSKCSLEEEILLRVDIEHQLQSTKEEMNFKQQMFNKELQEMRNQIQHVEKQKVRIESDYKSKYEGIMTEKLQELRDIYDEENEKLTNDVQTLYLAKYEDLKDQAREDASKLAEARDNNRDLTNKLEDLRAEHTVAISKVESLQKRLKELEELLDDQQRRANDTINLRDDEIRELRENMEEQLGEYENLMGVKVALDMELAAYRKLLEGEEVRLNITPPPSPVFGDKYKAKRPSKRPRTEDLQATTTSTTTAASGNIQIIEADNQGKFVRLFNSGTKEELMGGWIVSRMIDDQEPISYKFTPKFVLRGGQSVTIWANQGGGQHKPPTDLVFRQQSSWGTGKGVKTTITDTEGKEVASLLEEAVVTTFDDPDSGANDSVTTRRRTKLMRAGGANDEKCVIS